MDSSVLQDEQLDSQFEMSVSIPLLHLLLRTALDPNCSQVFPAPHVFSNTAGLATNNSITHGKHGSGGGDQIAGDVLCIHPAKYPNAPALGIHERTSTLGRTTVILRLPWMSVATAFRDEPVLSHCILEAISLCHLSTSACWSHIAVSPIDEYKWLQPKST